MAKRQSNTLQPNWTIITFGAVIVVLVIVLLVQPPRVVTNFEQCKAAGGALLESYPEQCLIAGTTFTSPMQVPDDSADYIGLTEAAALAKARQHNLAARVIERDGKSLPVTMDFSFGRHNFSVRDSKVYKVDIEGLATDTK